MNVYLGSLLLNTEAPMVIVSDVSHLGFKDLTVVGGKFWSFTKAQIGKTAKV